MCHQKYETQELYMHRMLHVNPTVTTKKKLIVNTQKKMRKGSKYNTKENNQNTREERKRRRKEQRGATKTARKKLISTYLSKITLNINGLNSQNKRHRIAEWLKK